MSIFTRLRHLLGGQKELSPEDLAHEEELKKQLRERCARFRRLLSSNKNALEIMSEVEEALAGSHPFGMSYVCLLYTSPACGSRRYRRSRR